MDSFWVLPVSGAFTESVVKRIREVADHPSDENPVAEAFRSFSIVDGELGFGARATQTDFVVVLASVRGAVLDVLEEAGVLK